MESLLPLFPVRIGDSLCRRGSQRQIKLDCFSIHLSIIAGRIANDPVTKNMFSDACVNFILTVIFYLEQNGGFFTFFLPVIIHDRPFAQNVERTTGHNSNVLSHRCLRQEILSGKNNSAALSTLLDLKDARR